MAHQETGPHPACPLCGGGEFVSGHMASGTGGTCGFIPSNRGLLGKFIGLPDAVTALKCRACGYLLQFAKPEPGEQ